MDSRSVKVVIMSAYGQQLFNRNSMSLDTTALSFSFQQEMSRSEKLSLNSVQKEEALPFNMPRVKIPLSTIHRKCTYL